MTEVAKFYILSHICIAFLGGVLLLALWFNIRARFSQLLEEDDSQKRVDKGMLYLSFAMFIWVISGCWIYGGTVFNFTETQGYQLGINLFSIVNNMFLLLALFYFYYAPGFIYHNKKNIKKIVIVIVFTSIVTFALPFILKENNVINGLRISGIPDLLLSAFLCYLLGISFYRTFVYRGLKIIGYISVLVILLIFVSQISEVFLTFGNDFSNNFIKIIAKTSLISIFLVLATTWVIRLASTPKPNEITIHFLDWGLVKLNIPTKNIYDQTIDFGSKTTQYKNLLKFAIRRKYTEGDLQTIPVNLGGEIKNQTYLTRIIENINDILQLDDTQKLDRRDLFTFIGESKYRLRIVPNNITIDKTLLEEFSESIENKDYKAFL
ncbi:hypothetical protein [Aequorivita antarctica]|uniref:Histidine kinase N-terminal 7TM region domain-containing protein n=1 Tax=Aequorivita antarctica TaxID=153266 RepID=A0A5C6YZI0_9FLAO|nr:hypothetical protein [Aequorivita antarctica]TXD73175.1 hypothetical protein ESU54_08545 [Aequorivita antarctica]SRX74933.1 hypothetical protein AEQU3_01920 [Aequorivita antarctica]